MSSISQVGWNERRLPAAMLSVPCEPLHGWRFWVPVAVLGLAMLASIHQLSHALDAGGEQVSDMDETAEVESRSTLKQAGFLLLGLVGTGLWLTPSAPRVSMDRLLGGSIVLLFAYTVASCLWSDAPETTLRRVIVPGMILVGAFGTMRHWQLLDLCRAVTILSTLFLCVGVLAELRCGTFLRGDEYRFSGTLHPNRQALNCGLLILASWALYDADRHWRWACLLGMGIAFLILTKSRGGAVSCLSATVLFWWLRASGVKRLTAVLSVGGAISLLLLMLAFAASPAVDWKALGAMGRTAHTADPTTLTGRIPIWQQVYADACQQPWLGAGYGAFWSGDRVHGYSFIHDNWAFSNAHSIYLETMANLGLVGVALGLLVVAVGVVRILTRLRERQDPALRFLLALIALCAVNGLVEAICVTPGYVFTVLLFGLAGVSFASGPRAEGAA